MKLNDLRPNQGSKKQRKRVGRGISAGQGKTAGRGTKGQGARSGGGKGQYFEGGQLPLVRRLPFKRGFTNINKIYYRPVNVGSLGDFAANDEVDPAAMHAAGLLKKPTDPVVILGDGELSVALSVKAHRFSGTAKKKIEAAGGSASVIEFK
jgi:large subunit ribosomal protein L15